MVHEHSVVDNDKHFVIDPVTRTIVNQSGKTVLIQNDHNSERFTFEMPKTVEGHDMTKCNVVEIHFTNTGRPSLEEVQNGIYEVDDLAAEGENATFSWLISSNATRYVGGLSFVAHFACVTDGVTEYSWDTEIYAGVSVNATIHNSEVVVNEYADILAQWRDILLNANGTGLTQIEQAVKEALDEIGTTAEEIIKILDTKGDATLAESWAVGGTGTRPGEDTNNAWYWALEAAKEAIKAKEYVESMGDISIKDNANLSGQGVAAVMTLQAFLDIVGTKLNEAADRLDAAETRHTFRDVALAAANWSDTYPYTQTVDVEGIVETSTIKVVGVKHDEGNTEAQDKAIDKAAGFLMSNESGVGEGTLTFKAKKKPTTDIVVIVEGG